MNNISQLKNPEINQALVLIISIKRDTIEIEETVVIIGGKLHI